MSNRGFLLRILPLILCLPWIADAIEKPNVIVIVTDDQGYGDMACHGNPWLTTPNLDRMHAGSVRLENYHVDPVCTPSRAALMTGRYCTRAGAWAVTDGRQLLNPDETTMAEVFAASGYRTGMFGKWHLGDPFPYAPRFRGFDDVVCHRAGGVDEIGNPDGNDYFDDRYFRNGVEEKFDGYCTNVFFDETLRFIGEKRDQPFFVYLPLNAMHGPFTVAEKYSQPFADLGHPEERSKFYGMIENFDENLGRLFATLEKREIDEDTLVIFMGDNGTAAGSAGKTAAKTSVSAGFNAGMRGKKGSVYEGGHRVACFARWPGHFTAGREIQQLTAHRDWLPTLIELCDLKKPDGVAFDGTSIAAQLRGSAANEEADQAGRTLFIERQGETLHLADQMLKPKAKYPQYAVLTEQWRLVNGELYDINADPGQTQNLSKQKPEIVADLYARYEKHFADVASHDSAYTRFQIGNDEENPTRFTVRDWHPTKGNVIWKKPQLGDDQLAINGFWAVDVIQAGRYSVRLSRHPEDAEKAMGANSAKLQLGTIEKTQTISASDDSVTFECDLEAGPALLQTWLTDAKSDVQRGAYYIAVERLR